MIIMRLVFFFAITQYCTAYGSNPTSEVNRPGTHTPQYPTLLFIALQRAAEKEGFDAIKYKVKKDRYKRVIQTDTNDAHDVPYAFLWAERINPSDKSGTAQFLFHALRTREIGTGCWYADQSYICEGLTRFGPNGIFISQVHDHCKDDVLAMLEELRPLETKIINSILTNSNPGPL